MPARKPFLLRLNEDLYRDLEAWAQAEFRSVNAQIEFLLRQAVLRRQGGSPPAVPVPPAPSAASLPSPQPAPPSPPELDLSTD